MLKNVLIVRGETLKGLFHNPYAVYHLPENKPFRTQYYNPVEIHANAIIKSPSEQLRKKGCVIEHVPNVREVCLPATFRELNGSLNNRYGKSYVRKKTDEDNSLSFFPCPEQMMRRALKLWQDIPHDPPSGTLFIGRSIKSIPKGGWTVLLHQKELHHWLHVEKMGHTWTWCGHVFNKFFLYNLIKHILEHERIICETCNKKGGLSTSARYAQALGKKIELMSPLELSNV